MGEVYPINPESYLDSTDDLENKSKAKNDKANEDGNFKKRLEERINGARDSYFNNMKKNDRLTRKEFIEIAKNKFYKACEFPSRLENFDLDKASYNCNIKKFAKLNEYVTSINDNMREGGSLYLYDSQTGTGKSVYAVAVMKKLIDKLVEWIYENNKNDWKVESGGFAVKDFISYPPKYLSIAKFYDNIKKSWDRNTDEEEHEVVNRFKKAKILLLDDIGSESSGSDFEIKSLYRVIEYRYDENIPTIFTSNFAIEDFNNLNMSSKKLKKMGERMASRLKGMCDDDYILNISGEDMRLK